MCVSVCVCFHWTLKTCFVEPLKMDAEDKWVVFSTPRMETLEYADCALRIKTSSRKIEGESPDLRYARRWRTKKAHFKTTTERRILSAGHFMCLGTAEASPVFWQTTDWSHIFFEDWWHLENAAAAWSFWEDIQNQFGVFYKSPHMELTYKLFVTFFLPSRCSRDTGEQDSTHISSWWLRARTHQAVRVQRGGRLRSLVPHRWAAW